MAKFSDYHSSREVADIMDAFIDKFPRVFRGFDLNKIGFVHSHKKGKRNPIKLRSVGHPFSVWMSHVYIVDVANETWQELSDKKKNLVVFHTMCGLPEGGFDESSDNYGKIRKPDYEMYAEEFAVTGGIPNWYENEDVRNPLEIDESEITSAGATDIGEDSAPKTRRKMLKKVPVTEDDIVASKKKTSVLDEEEVAVGEI